MTAAAVPGSPALTGLVLAGGRGTRMGADKAVIEIGGVRLVDRAVRLLSGICHEVLVATGERPLTVPGARCIADAAGGQGPMAGIVAGLQHASTPLIAVVAVDMPNASADVLRALAALWEGEAGVAPQVDGILEPLHALYAGGWADRYGALLQAGQRSPRRALEVLGARVVGREVWGHLAAGAFARSLNRPEDLAAYSADPGPGSPAAG